MQLLAQGGNEELRQGTPRSLRQLLADGAPPNTVLQNRRLKVSLDGVPQPRGTFGCCATGGLAARRGRATRARLW